jgi:hypothetical protein
VAFFLGHHSFPLWERLRGEAKSVLQIKALSSKFKKASLGNSGKDEGLTRVFLVSLEESLGFRVYSKIKVCML